MKINKKYLCIILICISILTFSMIRKTIENDAFYTISIGKFLLENKIDMQDHYCFVQGLSYTYPHWLFDWLIGCVYEVGNFLGIHIFTIIASIIFSISMFFIMKKRKTNTSIAFFTTLLAIQLFASLFVARAQIISYLLLMIEFYLLEALSEKKKFSYVVWLLIIPILIANLHSAIWYIYFIMYLPYFAEAFIEYRSLPNVMKRKRDKANLKLEELKKNKAKKQEIKECEKSIEHYNKYLQSKENEKDTPKFYAKKNNNLKLMIVLFILSVSTGLITPIGDTPYTYLIKNTIGSSFAYISEQAKLVIADRADFQIVFLLLIAIIGFTKTKLRIKDAFYILGFCFLAIISTRSVLFFTIFGIIILAKLITEFLEIYNINLFNLDKVMCKNIASVCVCLVVFFTSAINYTQIAFTDYVDKEVYPVEACDYIIKNLDYKNIRLYNDYDFGSYVLYREIPVFVDSRSELYCEEFNEGIEIFDDYISVRNGYKHYEEIFEKYDISHILVKIGSLEDVYLSEDDNYEKIYSDEFFVLFERNI